MSLGLAVAIGIPFGYGPGSLVLPSCTNGLAVAWYKDLNIKSKTFFDGVNTYYCINDSIGTRNDTVFFGQYLSSGVIDFKRTSGTFDYTDPSDGSLVEAVSIPNDGLYTIPANGICDIGIYPRDINNIYEVLNSGGGTDNVTLSSVPDITGDRVISFSIYIPSTVTIFGNFAIFISDAGSDIFTVDVPNTNTMRVVCNNLAGFTNGIATSDISNLKDTILNVVVTKTTRAVTSIVINGIENSTFFNSGLLVSSGAYFCNAFGIFVWDINLNSVNTYTGQPNGNLDSAWTDTTGSINGTVNGTPTKTNIITNTVEDVSYASFYPVCERAGAVLHDVKEESIHISVNTPVWEETLYGSDYLNQYGYVDKDDHIGEGYAFETVVDGSTITLNDDCLVPLAKWNYVNIIDLNGLIITDSNGAYLQVRKNI